MKTLKNEKCEIEINLEKKEITGRDKTDSNNLPAFYTNSKRGLKAGAELLEKCFHDQMTMYGAVQLLSGTGIKVRTYCMMD